MESKISFKASGKNSQQLFSKEHVENLNWNQDLFIVNSKVLLKTLLSGDLIETAAIARIKVCLN